MKLNLQSKHNATTGHILLVTVMVTGLIAFLVVAFLKLVKSQNSFTARAQTWESCIPVAEAGIEEAMAHLNNATTNIIGVDGWTLIEKTSISGGGDRLVYSKERKIGEGVYAAKISVITTNWDQATIRSTGYIPAPVTVASGGNSFFASLILPTLLQPNVNYLSRTIQVTAQKQPFFAKGMVAKHDIDLSGNNVFLDSFDSSNPSYSGAGGAYDPTKNKDNGDLATNSGLIDSLVSGNAEIMGKVSTGPGGTVSTGASGSVGSKTWVTGGNTGIEPGYVSDDMNVGFMDIQQPFTGGAFTPGPGVYNSTTYDYELKSGNYLMSSLSMGGKKKMIITGDATLYVTGDILLTGSAFIEIAPGASLKLYVGGATTSLMGNGIMNNNATADTFTYFGLPSNQNLAIGGNGQFVGAIYAPNAAFQLGGGGNNALDFIGSSVTKSVLMNGHFNFHYDEALGTLGPKTSYTITSWNEI